MMKRRALGRGLSALLSNEPIESVDKKNIREISVKKIDANQDQPRSKFNEEELLELAESIKVHGVLQPLLVRSVSEHPGRYQLIAGERRLRAAMINSLETVPCLCLNAEEAQVLEIALVENLQRTDLSPLDEARAFKHLAEHFAMTQEQIASRVGKSREGIANSIRLLNLPANVLSSLDSGVLSVGHAKALLAIKDINELDRIHNHVLSDGLNVRETEKLIRQSLEPKEKEKTDKEKSSEDIFMKDLEHAMEDSLQTKVQIKMQGKNKGIIKIHFYNLDQIDAILHKLKIEL